MKKQKRIFIQLLIFFTIILSGYKVFAIDFSSYVATEMEFSEEYLSYLKLDEEQKNSVIAPKMYDTPKTNKLITNPLYYSRALKSTSTSKYSLRDLISENMVVKNQQQTNTCWAFSSLASLESTLALEDFRNNREAKVYDFSERHMEYATSKTFLNNVINPNGHNREVGDGGFHPLSLAYLTNGTGAISENDMKFENNEDIIDISNIKNKEVITQVYDTVTFPSYEITDDTTKIKQQIKEHLMNYGAVEAAVHGDKLSDATGNCYNPDTGAIYCNSSSLYPIDHAVIIVGWNDEYGIENFLANNSPKQPGAWIVRNSWGDNAGDAGFMYISYEDVNIYSNLAGIISAKNSLSYENIYQYDNYGGAFPFKFNTSKIYLATVFNKKTTSNEYLTQVAINASETYTCKVYVNPNGTSKKMNDLYPVELKAGETETFDAGYHTIEFLNPIKINADSFVVVLEIQGSQNDSMSIMMEFNYADFLPHLNIPENAYTSFNNVTVENDKCFWTVDEGLATNEWIDTSTSYSLYNGNWPNFDTAIKAFTTSDILESIKITSPPTNTSYIEGQNFNTSGMKVTAYYANGTSKEISDYSITNGTNLQLSQTNVTISYKGKTTTQSIQVIKNTVESITIKNGPSTTEYWAGDDFDETGMIVEATYKDGTKKQITNYTIPDSSNLKNSQTTVTISYEGKTITQAITVKANPVKKIEIKESPDKVDYIVGQNFDKTGMIVEATYENGMTKQIQNYAIENGTNLQLEQSTITISYEGKTVTQKITVIEKAITSITIKTQPTKTEYFQNKEDLDLTGGIIEISYNDGKTETIPMTSDDITVSGFNNKNLGTNTITLTYMEKTITFSIQIKEVPKPENSNFDNMQGDLKRVRAYYFTDIAKEDYTILNVELSNIKEAEQNDKMEYYYYLSSSQKETDIKNWVKLNNVIENNTLSFEINTSDISNYEEVADSDVLYLYIKEVATRNNMQKEKTTSSLLLELKNINIEEYLDGEKIREVTPSTNTDSTSGEKTDTTVAPGIIPNAGKNILILYSIIFIIFIGRILYSKYKNIKLK